MAPPTFGRYKISEEIGRGSMGVVYRAIDPAIGRTVAIKVINESYLDSVGVEPSEYFERFKREAEVAGRLNHPAIAKIFDLGPNFIVMEYIDGRDLAALLQAPTPQHLSEALDIVTQIAGALDHAHANGVIHRDVKPANVLVQANRAVKVMDFGLARLDSSTLTAAGEILGSASYMAPEIVKGRPATRQSDIFSLGVVAYELMTGDRPFGGASISAIIHSIVQATPKPIHAVNLSLPQDYDAIFARVLAKEADDRYASAGEFAHALVLKKWADRDPTLVAPLPEISAEATTERDGRRIREAALAAATSAPGASPAPPPPHPPEATIILGAPLFGSPPAPAVPQKAAAPPARRGNGLVWGALGCGAVLLLALLAAVGLLVARFRSREAIVPPSASATPSTPEAMPAPAAAEPPATAPAAGASSEPVISPSPSEAPARLRVTSAPNGARVLVGGRVRGTTPLALDLPPGPASIVVDKAGFRAWHRDLRLTPGSEETLRAELEAKPQPTPPLGPAAAATPSPLPVTNVGDLVALTPDVIPPKRLSGPSPDMPRSVPRVKSATVLVRFLVTEEGKVEDPTIVESAGPALDKACLDAVRKWRYSPALKNDVPVRVGQQARFRFEIR
jgi:eukaryotic-like serine/threonine-protein kinase